MSKLTTTWWIIFYKDQLLLKKTDNGFSIPCAGQPPIHISPETNIHEICMLDGHPCKAIAIDYPVEESDKYMMTGLRASYDFIPLKQYQTAGKAAEILHWDRNSRFCPACGTAMEQKAPIMKKCPKCGNEMYPSISTAILVLIRKEDKLLLVHARNFKGTFNSRFSGNRRNFGRMRCARGERRNRTGRKEYHLFCQSALAISQWTDGRIYR